VGAERSEVEGSFGVSAGGFENISLESKKYGFERSLHSVPTSFHSVGTPVEMTTFWY